MNRRDKLFTLKLEEAIWKIVPSESEEALILDVRDQTREEVKYLKLDLNTLELTNLDLDIPWWSGIEAFSGNIFYAEYQDAKDPTNKKFYSLGDGVRQEITEEDIPKPEKVISQPYIYEEESDYFNTVKQFINLDLSGFCEYLELNNKIIISYYLRSGKKFDRYIRILEDGKVCVAEVQDKGMEGLAAGAFMVFDDKVFYVRNKHEICIYSF